MKRGVPVGWVVAAVGGLVLLAAAVAPVFWRTRETARSSRTASEAQQMWDEQQQQGGYGGVATTHAWRSGRSAPEEPRPDPNAYLSSTYQGGAWGEGAGGEAD